MRCIRAVGYSVCYRPLHRVIAVRAGRYVGEVCLRLVVGVFHTAACACAVFVVMAERIDIAALVAVAANRAGVGRVATLGTSRLCHCCFVVVGVCARVLCAAVRAKAVFVVMAV